MRSWRLQERHNKPPGRMVAGGTRTGGVCDGVDRVLRGVEDCRGPAVVTDCDTVRQFLRGYQLSGSAQSMMNTPFR